MLHRLQKSLINKAFGSRLKKFAFKSVQSSADLSIRHNVLDGQSDRKKKIAITHAQVPRKAMDLMAACCDITQVRSNPPRHMELMSAVKGADAIFWGSTDKLNSKVLDAAGNQLKVVSVRTSHYDYVDVEELKKRNILLGHSRVNAGTVADVAVALMLNAARRIQEGRMKILTDAWRKYDVEHMLGRDINGSVIGFFGFGNVGQEIARRLVGFDVKGILYTDPVRTSDTFERQYSATPVAFNDMIAASDILFCCAPLLAETQDVFNRSAFEKMKNTAVFVNVGSGASVNHKDLHDALQRGQIFAAGLDVTNPEPLSSHDPLLKLQNLVITPGLGTRTKSTNIHTSVTAAENILLALAQRPMIYPVYQNTTCVEVEPVRQSKAKYIG